jgi:indole-3-glycerol phosphate synthase
MTVILGINNRNNEPLEVRAELMNTSEATDFIKQILSFLAYSGSSIVKTELNLSSHVADG